MSTAGELIDKFCSRLSSYLSVIEINKVKEACLFSAKNHEGQMRQNGDPYITHPLAVLNILADLHMDHHTLMAAVLHDVIEDCDVSVEQVQRKFGVKVANLVDGVTKLSKIDFNHMSKEEQLAESFQKMVLAMSKDLKVILVKLADRMHNMRTLDALPLEKQKKISRETLEIYAPIAQRLGINDIRVEFEDLCFRYLYPARFKTIQKVLSNVRGNRGDLVLALQQKLDSRITDMNIDVQVIGREKHVYSIYRKMKFRQVPLKNIMDLFAFRIIARTVDDCYRVLGIVHSIFKPLDNLFKDYIALQKVNGYQSLHTVVMGSLNDMTIPVEVQIRTAEMDTIADRGIAAHWNYKNGSKMVASVPGRASEWITDLLEMQRFSGSAIEFIEHVKSDLFPKEVLVFTPDGDIVELPKGATPIDFAYRVHTDLGNQCVGCRLNDRLAPLSEPLQSGQIVKITHSPRGKPNPAWLDFVVTPAARSAIRHFLKHQRQGDSIQLGMHLLNHWLMEAETTLASVDKQQIKKLLQETGHKSIDEVTEQIGLGNTPAYIVARILLGQEAFDHISLKNKIPLIIDNANEHTISFANCCGPIPGDPIYGNITAGRGIVVHRHNCGNITRQRYRLESCVPLSWSVTVEGEFHAEIKVEVENIAGIMGLLASRAAEAEAGVDNISLIERSDSIVVIKLLVLVKGRVHLAEVMRRLRNQVFVNSVKRHRG